MNKNNISIIIPAYNEEKSLGKVISDLKKHGYPKIIVVDDGSKDRTYEIAKKAKVDVYRHFLNRGLGGALGTGIEAAIRKKAEYMVTFDADGQHDPKDIARVVKPLASGNADAVVGSRLINPEGMPLIRRIGNLGLNVITWALFGVWTTDSQSGLRAFTLKAAKRLQIKTNRMEVSSEIIKEIGRNRLKFAEVPIKAIYTDYSLEKGQSAWNGIRILLKLILKKMME